MYRTRFGPSPTGFIHIGNMRTAYFNWLAARQSNGFFFLRIDDTDLKRSDPRYVGVIMDTMKWLGIEYDSVIYQSARFKLYREFAEDLGDWIKLDDGAVKLDLHDKSNLPKFWVDDVVGKVYITENDIENADGMVLMKSDGSPSYNWASVVDDVCVKINYIIRGSDHITNTSRQAILWHLLGAEMPKMAHVGLIAKDGKPLSKSEGAASMLWYREKGYDPDAMLNFMVRMGWSPTKDDKTTKFLPKERMREMFLTEGKMRSSLANMDMAKLEAFDRKYKAAKNIFRTGQKLVDA